MNSEDDPEARIRELERGIANQAEASELGTGQDNTGGAYLPPPPVPGYAPPGYNAQTYGSTQPYATQSYGEQPYGTQPYGTQPYGPPLFFFYAQGVRRYSVVGVRPDRCCLPGDRRGRRCLHHADVGCQRLRWQRKDRLPVHPVDPVRPVDPVGRGTSIPPAPGAPGADPNVISPTPGETVTVSGIDENKTIACNDATVNISGIRNTVNITGHCVKVSVSGISNVITVDNADGISASGFENRVTFHSGSPAIREFRREQCRWHQALDRPVR